MDTTDRERSSAMSPEHWLSVLLGVGVIVYTLTRSLKTLLGFALGGWLVYRGASGKSLLTDRLKGIKEHARRMGMQGMRGMPMHRMHMRGMEGAGMRAESAPSEVSRAVTINRPVAEVYAFWRNVEGLAPYLEYVQSIQVADPGRSNWTLSMPGPRAATVDWQAELVEERENERLRWGSRPDTFPEMSVAVDLAEAAGGRGTETTMTLTMPSGRPMMAGGPVGQMMRRLAAQQIERDMRRIKSVLEAGEAPTVASQPTGLGAKEEESDVKPLRQLVVDSIRRVTL